MPPSDSITWLEARRSKTAWLVHNTGAVELYIKYKQGRFGLMRFWCFSPKRHLTMLWHHKVWLYCLKYNDSILDCILWVPSVALLKIEMSHLPSIPWHGPRRGLVGFQMSTATWEQNSRHCQSLLGVLRDLIRLRWRRGRSENCK